MRGDVETRMMAHLRNTRVHLLDRLAERLLVLGSPANIMMTWHPFVESLRDQYYMQEAPLIFAPPPEILVMWHLFHIMDIKTSSKTFTLLMPLVSGPPPEMPMMWHPLDRGTTISAIVAVGGKTLNGLIFARYLWDAE